MKSLLLRKISCTIIFSLLVSFFIIFPLAQAYSGADAPYGRNQVDLLIQLGSLDPNRESEFDILVTRAAGALMLWKTFFPEIKHENVMSESPYDDYENEQWWSNAVKVAGHVKMFAGSARDGKFYFDPAATFTREQFATVMWNLFGKKEPATIDDNAQLCSSWAQKACAWMKENNLMFKGGEMKPRDGLNKLDFIVVTGNAKQFVNQSMLKIEQGPKSTVGTSGISGTTVPSQLSEGRLKLGVTHGQTKRANTVQIAADGIQLINEYLSWGELEPNAGNYNFSEQLDGMVEDAKKNGLTMALEIQLTNELCDSAEMSEQRCIGEYLPRDVTFDRNTSSFETTQFVNRLSALVKTIMQRYDPRVLAYVYVGNEPDTYIRTVKESKGRDLFPSFQQLIEAIQRAVNTLPQPRAKFGTIFTFFGLKSPDYHEPHRRMVKIVDIMGFTVYPTVPWLDETGTPLERTKRFLDNVLDIAGTHVIAITEIGETAGPHPSGTSPEKQAEFARFVIDYYRRHRSAFEYISWFSIYDNPNFAQEFFGGTGLLTIDDAKRPAYNIWVKQAL